MIKKLFLISLVLLLNQCSNIQLETHQLVAKKQFDGVPLEKLWESLTHVVQSEGYGVESEDKKQGVIIASIQRTPGLSDSAVSVRTLGHLKEEVYKLIVNIRRAGSGFETRLSIQVTRRHSLGGFHGDEIINPTLYEDFYRKVQEDLKQVKS